MTNPIITAAFVLTTLPALAGSTAPILDQPSSPALPEWSFKMDLYGWAQSLDGDLSIRGRSVPVEVGFSDIIENLDIAVMTALEVGYGRWRFLADINYAEIEADTALLRGRIPVDVTQQQFLGNFIVGYETMNTETMNVGVYGGIRVNSIDLELDAPRPRFDRSWDDTWVDPIIGARFQAELGDSFFFRAVGDIGGFGAASDLTWQAMAGFGYRVSERGTFLLAYRGIGTDYTNGNFTYDVVAHGPLIGFEYKF